MNGQSQSRFDAENVVRLIVVTGEGRFEMQLADAQGATHVVSLPVRATVDLARLICDASERAPYLVGGQPVYQTK